MLPDSENKGTGLASPDCSGAPSNDGDDSALVSDKAQRYQRWLDAHSLTEGAAQLMAERMMTRWKRRPSIEVLICVEPGEEAALADTIDSLASQLYVHWRLTVVSRQPCPDVIFQQQPQLKWRQTTDFQHGLNQVAKESSADWLGLIPVGGRIAPQGLFAIADYDNLKGLQWQLIYADEDHINAQGERSQPLFKPDINIDYLRSYPYIGHFCFIRRQSLEKIGGIRCYRGCANEDLVLRAVDAFGEPAIGHIADVLHHRPDTGHDVLHNIDEQQWNFVVTQHIARNALDAEVTQGYLSKTNRVVYRYSDKPMISIIIPSKDRPELIVPCITSLFEKTSYPNFEVILVDNGSEVDDVFYHYDQWKGLYGNRFRLISYNHPFNFSAMNNLAASQSSGEYLVLLNNDTEVLHGEWLERMLMHARRPEVGAVGARLLFPNKKIQHAGVIVGMMACAGHVGGNQDFTTPGYMGRYQVDQNFSAVTAACLMTRRSVYEEMGGLDDDVLKVLFNDVDYCLKLREAGYHIVWTPYSTLVHKESVSQRDNYRDKMHVERAHGETRAFVSRWKSCISIDPAYNKNLSFKKLDYDVAGEYCASWNVDFHERPRVLAMPLDNYGCGQYRIQGPMRSLRDKALAEVSFGTCQETLHRIPLMPELGEILRMQPDVLFMQTLMSDIHLLALDYYKKNTQLFFVGDIDDLKTDIPAKNSRAKFGFKDVRFRMRRFLSYCDRLIVSTEPLVDAYRHLIDDIVVVPNRLETSLWGDVSSQRRTTSKPRVGWCGAQQHDGDLEIMIDVVKQTAAEIDWVFMGMCLDELKPYVKEIHEFVAFFDYPAKLASLNLDLAVAPLEMHAFNEAKSNLRLLEYGIMGWPVVCTDIYPYQGAPVKRVPNTVAAWIAAIRERVNDLDAAYKEGDALRNWVRKHWMLDDHLDDWVRSLVPDTVRAQTGRAASA